MAQPSTQEVAVVGAGIVGLSSAVCIQRKCPGVKVTIIADKFDRHTTSNGAGGIFVPSAAGIDEQIFNFWAAEGAKHFYGLAFSSKSSECGVCLVTGYELMFSDEQKPWFKHMIHVSKMSPEMVNRVSPYYTHGYMVTTVIVEGPKYLPWLMKRFLENGGQVIEKKLTSFEELAGKYDIVVNCTGLGSAELTSDPEIQPMRGHILRVSAPWIKHFVHCSDDRYILPAADTVAVGGSHEMGRADLVPLASDSRQIFDDVKRKFRFLEGAKILYDWIGLRPYRTKVRLELETMNYNGKRLQMVHNYGHGAFGISLSWGTGFDAAQKVHGILKADKTTLAKL